MACGLESLTRLGAVGHATGAGRADRCGEPEPQVPQRHRCGDKHERERCPFSCPVDTERVEWPFGEIMVQMRTDTYDLQRSAHQASRQDK